MARWFGVWTPTPIHSPPSARKGGRRDSMASEPPTGVQVIAGASKRPLRPLPRWHTLAAIRERPPGKGKPPPRECSGAALPSKVSVKD